MTITRVALLIVTFKGSAEPTHKEKDDPGVRWKGVRNTSVLAK